MKKQTYKIVNEEGDIIEKGFRTRMCANQMIPILRLNKEEILEVVKDK